MSKVFIVTAEGPGDGKVNLVQTREDATAVVESLLAENPDAHGIRVLECSERAIDVGYQPVVAFEAPVEAPIVGPLPQVEMPPEALGREVSETQRKRCSFCEAEFDLYLQDVLPAHERSDHPDRLCEGYGRPGVLVT